jgi:hypothetical protein
MRCTHRSSVARGPSAPVTARYSAPVTARSSKALMSTPACTVVRMPARRLPVLALVLALSVSLSGCNARDWWDLKGTYHVELAPIADNSAMGDFQKLTIAVYGVSLKQEGEINPHHFTFSPEPLFVDMVDLANKGERQPLAQMKSVIRPVTSVTIRIAVAEAIDASGKSLPPCFPGEPVESRPCVSTPKNGAYLIDTIPFSPPRGGSVTFGFPLLIQYAPQANEYFIQTDDPLATVETEK